MFFAQFFALKITRDLFAQRFQKILIGKVEFLMHFDKQNADRYAVIDQRQSNLSRILFRTDERFIDFESFFAK